MKKTLLFSLAMCCVISVSAQRFMREPKIQKSWKDKIKKVEQLNRDKYNFTEKLDSVTGEETRIIFDYDSRFNCTQMYSYYYFGSSWVLDMGYDYAYDEQDRMTSMITTSSGSPSKEEYAYNEQNRIREILYYDWWSETWHLDGKEVIEYDNSSNILSSHLFFYEDGNWSEHAKIIYEYDNGLLVLQTSYLRQIEMEPYHQIEYSYNSLGLCLESIESHWFGASWEPWEKMEYSYNEQALCTEDIAYGLFGDECSSIRRNTYEYDSRGNCIRKTFFNHYNNSPDWINSSKHEYYYDDNNNCITHNFYYYDHFDEEWNLNFDYNLIYDLTTDATSISGLLLVWEEIKGDLVSIYNKLKQFVLDGEYILDFHYSSTVGLNESAESKLTLWPNPTTELLRLNAEGLQQVEIFSMDSKHVMNIEHSFESINVSNLAIGCYLLKATFTNGSNAVQKFVKE